MRLLSLSTIATLVIISSLFGCGSGASNNDQGTSVTFIGYRADADDCEEGSFSNGSSEPFSSRTEPSAQPFAGGIVAGMVLENNLSSQHVIVQNAFFEYYIPGATAQPPATSSVLGGVIPAAGVSVDDGGGTTAEISEFCGEVFVVPAEVRTWMLLNRTSLPEPPFTMEVRGFATVLTEAGDRLDTNEVKYFVQFLPDIIISGVDDEDGGDTSGTVDETTDGGTTDSEGSSDTGGDSGSGGDSGTAGSEGGDGDSAL